MSLRFVLGAALACILMSCSPGASAEELSASQWQEDLDEFVEVLQKKHENPFHRVSETEFLRRAAEFRAQIPTLAEYEIVVGLVRIGALIGDGHTAIRPYDRLQVLPLKLFWFGHDLRVTGTHPDQRDILGWKVTGIEGTPIDAVARAIDALIPQGENRYFVMGWNGYWIKVPEALHALGLTKSAERAEFSFESDTGETKSLSLDGLSLDEYGDVEWSSAFDPKPAFLMPQDEAIRVESLEQGSTLRVAFRSYPSRKDMKKVSKQIRERIESEGTEVLVIDLRGNGGGDFKKGLHLIKEIQKTKIHEQGKVYALTDRWTFSAAMSNAAHFRQKLNATLVGEPPGERPNGYAENHAFELPRSGISASCSSEYYEFQEEDTPTLAPDHPIAPDFAAWREGRDPVMEWVLAQ